MLAYLISAYTDPDHLARLIAALDHEADFYVHVDANVDDAPFRRLLPKKVHFVPRHHVSWGGWEQVAYQYELIKAVINSGRDYTHLVCLSAQDYPCGATTAFILFLSNIKTPSLLVATT